MTAKTRRNLLRMADAAAHAQERSAKHLIKLQATYGIEYPDLGLQAQLLARQALQLRDLINRFRSENM